ncbi:MAG: 5-methylthioadenosine/S-adenosylhomocysteine nucleosidase [Thermoleophilia bacterium]|nr:5-methylthioadenosine/S-adenosylhomocysteine nucleosidase [Thermoleophilia bacterium]
MLLIVAATEPELRGVTGLQGVESLACGIGPVDAAISVAARLAHDPRPTAILHLGIAGARRAAGLTLGTVVLGAGSSYEDTASVLVERTASPDAELLERAAAALPEAVHAVIGTSADVGGTAECDVEAMEGFAVLRAAELAGVPALEVRTIANEVEEADRALWDFTGALDRLEAVTPVLVQALG